MVFLGNHLLKKFILIHHSRKEKKSQKKNPLFVLGLSRITVKGEEAGIVLKSGDGRYRAAVQKVSVLRLLQTYLDFPSQDLVDSDSHGI